MKVHTYYHPLFPQREADDRSVIELWRESWARHGWEPVVLGFPQASRHLLFEAYDQKMRSLPTVNDISFELASYHRHLAMALAGGGLLTDFDVINYGFRPGDVALTELCSLETPPTPAVLYGTWEDFEWLIRYFMRFNPLHAVFENRRPHISDMTIVNGLNIPSHSVCRQYHQPGWEVASLVHYTSNSTGGTGGKAERMKADLSRRSFSGGGRMKI